MQNWYIGKVVDIEDPDKRRRIKVRGPYELEDTIETEKLDWIVPLQLQQDYFFLPDVDTSVLIVRFGELKAWLDLPNKAAWEEFGDDYVNAWLYTHKDVLSAKYIESEGFTFALTGAIKLTTNNTELTVDDDKVELVYDKVTLTTDGKSVTLKCNNVEFSTDGSKATLKNQSVDLATLIDDLLSALQKHTHASNMGPTMAPTNISDFMTNQQKFKQLLQ